MQRREATGAVEEKALAPVAAANKIYFLINQSAADFINDGHGSIVAFIPQYARTNNGTRNRKIKTND